MWSLASCLASCLTDGPVLLFFCPCVWLQYRILLYISQQQPVTVATIHLNFELMVRAPHAGVTSPFRFVGKMALNIPNRKRSSAQTWTSVSNFSERSPGSFWERGLMGGWGGRGPYYLSESPESVLLWEQWGSAALLQLPTLFFSFSRFGPITTAPFMMTRDKTGLSCLSQRRLLWRSINR